MRGNLTSRVAILDDFRNLLNFKLSLPRRGRRMSIAPDFDE